MKGATGSPGSLGKLTLGTRPPCCWRKPKQPRGEATQGALVQTSQLTASVTVTHVSENVSCETSHP